MACFHPLKAFPTGYYTENGKDEFFIASHDEKIIMPDTLSKKWPDRKWIRALDTWIEIPCGHCIGCKIDRSRMWAFRCLAENRMHLESWFITLTYDDQHLPVDGKIRKRDLQLFFKRLRFNGFKFRYFASGELGDLSKRPHYHALLFGLHLDPDKLKLWKPGKYPLYNHPDIEKCWPFGYAVLGGVSYDSAQYVAKYVIKKYGDEDGFITMSRRPGLGFAYMAEHYNPFSGSITIGDGKGRALVCALPRSFRDKYAIKPLIFDGNGPYLRLINSMTVSGWENSFGSFKDLESFREIQEDLANRPIKVKV